MKASIFLYLDSKKMNEDFLHYAWKYKVFSKAQFKTTNEEDLTIIKSGIHNKNAGPDFLNAQIEIEHQLWVGNVEIHVKSSDWYLHKHELDLNYDAVILHVVWEEDTPIFMKNNKMLPTFVIKDFVSDALLTNYRKLFFVPSRWIPCQDAITTVDEFTLSNWKERLFFERLESKSKEIENLLDLEKSDYEAVLFQLLAKNFGLKVNGDSFIRWSQSIPFSLVKKLSGSEKKLMSLFFGQAGFLEEDVEDPYQQELKEEYVYLKHKYHLKAISTNQFSFFRMRPNNFPTIRLAQMVSLYHGKQNLFSELVSFETLQEFYNFFSLQVHPFWRIHYNFKSVSKSAPKKLTHPFIDLLIINTIIPLKFLYQRSRGMVEEDSFLKILDKINPEKNNIISKFSEIKIKAKNAFDTQALLELKNNYCGPKRCLECAIGSSILTQCSLKLQ